MKQLLNNWDNEASLYNLAAKILIDKVDDLDRLILRAVSHLTPAPSGYTNNNNTSHCTEKYFNG